MLFYSSQIGCLSFFRVGWESGWESVCVCPTLDVIFRRSVVGSVLRGLLCLIPLVVPRHTRLDLLKASVRAIDQFPSDCRMPVVVNRRSAQSAEMIKFESAVTE